MAKSTSNGELWLHRGTGQWCRTIEGKRRYFGRDREKAEEKYRQFLAEQAAPMVTRQTLRLADLANSYMDQQDSKRRSGEITHHRFGNSYRGVALFVEHFGRDFPLAAINAQRLQAYRAWLSERFGSLETVRTHLGEARGLLKYAYDTAFVDAPIRQGNALRAPSVHARRRQRGRQTFTPSEVRRLLEASQGRVQCWILLGIGNALGANDISRLRWEHLRGEWLDFPRPKTGAARRSWLWPEAREALAAVGGEGPTVFTHAPRTISRQVKALVVANDLPLRGHYNLRHTFADVASQIDESATRLAMGHSDPSMLATYRHHIADERLAKVSEAVHRWVFG